MRSFESDRFVPELPSAEQWDLGVFQHPGRYMQTAVLQARYRQACRDIGEIPLRDLVAEKREAVERQMQRTRDVMNMEMMFGSPHVPMERKRNCPL